MIFITWNKRTKYTFIIKKLENKVGDELFSKYREESNL